MEYIESCQSRDDHIFMPGSILSIHEFINIGVSRETDRGTATQTQRLGILNCKTCAGSQLQTFKIASWI